jgi:AraC family L-rhamnose operon regulatory protein RhaS
VEQNLLHTLEQITEEEQEILNGSREVKKAIYTTGSGFTIDSRKMLESGNVIALRTHTRFIRFPLHTHNYVELMYVCKGSITHIIEGKKVVVDKGELLFLNQHTTHEILPAGIDDIGINFIILPEFFDVTFSMVGRDNVLANFLVGMLKHDSSQGQYLHFKVSDSLQIQNLMENMIHSLIHRQGNEGRINQTTMGLLFLHLLNETRHIEESMPNQYENMILMSTLRYIEQNYTTASLTELCDNLNQSIYSLSRLIKSGTGFNFKELLQRKRMNKAVELLCDTALPVDDIINAVGYENNSYFYRKFKERYGMTPRDYRLLHRGEQLIRL